jgi:hypothetical protein
MKEDRLTYYAIYVAITMMIALLLYLGSHFIKINRIKQIRQRTKDSINYKKAERDSINRTEYGINEKLRFYHKYEN